MSSFNNPSISLLLCSCDSYKDTWIPFCNQLKKNWPSFNMPVYLNTESLSFKYDDLDIVCPFAGKNIQFRQWSDRLLKVLDIIPSDYILFMLDDFWLTKPVDVQSFDKIFNIVVQDKNIGFVCLLNENNPGAIDCEYDLLRKSTRKKIFRITTQAGIWKKSYLQKLLRSHESAWYFETRATFRSRFYSEKIYDVKKSVLNYPVGGFLWGGKCLADYIDLYPRILINDCLNKRGTINKNDLRSYPNSKKGISYYLDILRSIMPKF